MKTVIFFLVFVFGVIENSFSQKFLELNNISQNTNEVLPLDFNTYITEPNAWDITDTVYANYGDSLEWKSFQDANNNGLDVSIKIYKKSIWDQLSGNKWQSGQYVSRYDDKYLDTIMLTNNPETNIYNPNNYIYENNTSYIICISQGGYIENIQLTVGVDPNASISTIDESITIKAYPNPTIDYVTVDFESSSDVELAVYNMSGAIVYYEDVKYNGSQSIKINMSDYTSGMYFLQVGNERIKLMKE